MHDIIVLQQAITSEKFADIQSKIFSDGFPWFYTGTTLGNNESKGKNNYSFFHNAYYYDEGYSEIGHELESAILDSLGYMKFPINKMLRIRLGLITVTEHPISHTPHVDFPYEHYTGLLYLNDSDGDTIIYNQKLNTSANKQEFDQNVRSKENDVITQFTPEENKLVIFDGLLYHSSTSPTTVDRRVVVNFNFI